VHEAYDRAPVPLTMHHDPICVSFAVVCPPPEAGADGAGAKPVLLADPTAAEEAVADATVVVTASGTTEKSVLFGLHKHGGIPVPAEHVMRCSTAGCLQAAERNAQIREILKRFEASLLLPFRPRLAPRMRGICAGAARRA
jgi:exosome complex component RRP45